MLTAIIIVARVQPGTSKGITDLLLPQPSSVLKVVSGPSSLQKLRAEKCKSKDLQILMFIKKEATRGCGHVRCLQDFFSTVQQTPEGVAQQIEVRKSFVKRN